MLLKMQSYENVQLAPWLGSRSTVSITAKVCLISTAVVRFISTNTDAVDWTDSYLGSDVNREDYITNQNFGLGYQFFI